MSKFKRLRSGYEEIYIMNNNTQVFIFICYDTDKTSKNREQRKVNSAEARVKCRDT